jgi:hypothetical protein
MRMFYGQNYAPKNLCRYFWSFLLTALIGGPIALAIFTFVLPIYGIFAFLETFVEPWATPALKWVWSKIKRFSFPLGISWSAKKIRHGVQNVYWFVMNQLVKVGNWMDNHDTTTSLLFFGMVIGAITLFVVVSFGIMWVWAPTAGALALLGLIYVAFSLWAWSDVHYFEPRRAKKRLERYNDTPKGEPGWFKRNFGIFSTYFWAKKANVCPMITVTGDSGKAYPKIV